MGFYNTIKDKASSYLGERILRDKLKKYGTILELKIDSEKNNIFLKIFLIGESQPIELMFNNYIFTKEGDEYYIIVDEINISREWIHLLAEDFLTAKKFKLPKGITSTLVKMVM